jgi:tRNA (mo5U34)-methyltransferase
VRETGAMLELSDLAKVFEVDKTIVSALKGADLAGTTAADRQRVWAKQDGRRDRYIAEYLLPRIVRPIERAWPEFVRSEQGSAEISNEKLRAEVQSLDPWTVSWPLREGLATLPDNRLNRASTERLLFRRDLINGTVARLLGERIADTTVLDIGCNSGFFSFDIASRGAKHVDGFDLRAQNVAQAQFLGEFYGVPKARFVAADVDEFSPGEQWDVVLNLGVLYHMTDPFTFLHRTYELCRKFAIIDTTCHPEPIAAYLIRSDKDVARPVEGRERYELHPTYRGVIETIRFAGFSEVIEIVGVSALPHDLYARGVRRCFLAIK